MRKALILSGSLVLVASSLPAQTVRWNDRPPSSWQDQPPRVRVSFDGSRGVGYGEPMSVRFEVDDDAYVTVVRVDDDGRMTILFPYSRSQRAAVRGGQVYYARNPRLGGQVSFVAADRMSGYVFALASYAPLDFSVFENRDYNRMGGYSRFTQVNRSIARRPDVFIDRFAAAVLWDVDTPYDYDVDYYHPIGFPSTFNSFAMCGSGFGRIVGWRTYMAQFSSWERTAYPSLFSCYNQYNSLRCYAWMAFSSSWGCAGYRPLIATRQPIPVGGQPVDTASVPNEGVVRGGLFAPTPLPVDPGGDDPPPVERPGGRFDQPRGEASLDDILSIPSRATRKMKEDDARREGAEATPARAGFDRIATDKTNKGGSTVADAPERVQRPSREVTKTKATGTPRRETTRNGGFGSTGRTSEPRPADRDRDRVSRPSDTKTTGTSSPASIKGSTTEKKKPPKN
jgi:hypothetical protein